MKTYYCNSSMKFNLDVDRPIHQSHDMKNGYAYIGSVFSVNEWSDHWIYVFEMEKWSRDEYYGDLDELISTRYAVLAGSRCTTTEQKAKMDNLFSQFIEKTLNLMEAEK